jgi:hypothetical protein
MERLTLQLRRWYAMTYYAAKTPWTHVSPIWVIDLTAEKTGKGDLRLEFFHANYSEGVQGKVYDLRVLRRTAGFRCAEVDYGNGEPKPAVIITELTLEWLCLHWSEMQPEGDPQAWCDEHLGPPGHPAR